MEIKTHISLASSPLMTFPAFLNLVLILFPSFISLGFLDECEWDFGACELSGLNLSDRKISWSDI